ncbi:VanZ family protein [Bacillus pseudomycoides]|uniref:VanZ family protein n=1 Tax=Bacillus pseudomycoides TaxID=64104 RepID=UPI000BF7B2FF|nr:permease prefix domain 1-containing protein [Bacillus pseudomycoides]PFX40906.1 teicoplanin resistance protein VanZ [Bacillus pseudomycoides]PFZ69188.1 teicoplanin resistance protein VanZ [Bacillus pseudomycoides]PGE22472.1 teicoplanin resistance protein VanZ [Bacillus pseudomycoides]
MKEFENYIECIVKKTNLDRSAREELAIELLDHLISLKEEYVKQGMSIEQAKQLAIQHFGEPDSIGGELQKSIFPYEKFIKRSAWSLFVPYILFFIWYQYLGNSVGREWFLRIIEQFSRNHDVMWLLRTFIDITPFYTLFLYNIPGYWIAHVVKPIILLIPLGFLIPILFHRFRSSKAAFMLFVKLTLSIELLYIVMLVGTFDTTNIIFHLVGLLVGFMGWKLLQKLQVKKFPTPSNMNYVK